MSTKDFVEQHYVRHAQHFENDLVDEERIRISQTWFDESTADYWRHARAYECAALLSDRPQSRWLTIGDGRWGLDSIRIRKKGFASALPSDISEALLRASKDRGFIEEYAIENAERLSFGNESFDYVFCKESLHHFPRPFAALYEMLRVCSEAVFIVEPNDTYEASYPEQMSSQRPARLSRILRAARMAVHELLGRKPGWMPRPKLQFNSPDWENSGNYVYAISRREIEKVALGLNLPQLAVKGLNDHYVQGCEFEPADESRSEIFRQLVQTIREKDRLCRERAGDYNMIMAGLFARAMRAETRAKFEASGWEVIDLPANPYIPRAA
jgi:2-polyprenyl-3-methyl-5-hydroxy-6-metoxy-1,4-benzoquinol methylase